MGVSNRKNRDQPIIIDAEETFMQKAQRVQRDIEARSHRVVADAELQTQMIVDRVQEDYHPIYFNSCAFCSGKCTGH